MSYVQLRNYTKVIKNKTILNDISLSLESGTIYGFFGRNASGKTMLFRAICGLIKPTSGSVEIGGVLLGKERAFPESVGVIIEQPGFWNEYTGFKNLLILASIKNIISAAEIKESMVSVGLDPKDQRKVKEYSLGMKQRLALAQAIMEKPKLLVLDEPTNALDEETVHQVRHILHDERKRGATILIASHNREDLELLADVKFRVSEGQVYTI